MLRELLTIVGSPPFCYRGGSRENDARRILALMGEPDADPLDVLEEASDILGGFGVEYVRGPGDTGELTYVNNGETYEATLAHDGTCYLVTSWGGWLEGAEAEHAEETGEMRCPYCGEWNEPEHEDPDDSSSDWLCGSCGNLIAEY